MSEEYLSNVSNQAVINKMLKQNHSLNCKEMGSTFEKFYLKLFTTLEDTFSKVFSKFTSVLVLTSAPQPCAEYQILV